MVEVTINLSLNKSQNNYQLFSRYCQSLFRQEQLEKLREESQRQIQMSLLYFVQTRYLWVRNRNTTFRIARVRRPDERLKTSQETNPGILGRRATVIKENSQLASSALIISNVFEIYDRQIHVIGPNVKPQLAAKTYRIEARSLKYFALSFSFPIQTADVTTIAARRIIVMEIPMRKRFRLLEIILMNFMSLLYMFRMEFRIMSTITMPIWMLHQVIPKTMFFLLDSIPLCCLSYGQSPYVFTILAPEICWIIATPMPIMVILLLIIFMSYSPWKYELSMALTECSISKQICSATESLYSLSMSSLASSIFLFWIKYLAVQVLQQNRINAIIRIRNGMGINIGR